MTKKMNFAIIGCGRVSGKHLSAIRQLSDDAKLIAVCDIVKEKAKQKAQEFNVPYYTNYNQMIANHPEIDIINVLVPTGYHASIVIDLAQYGHHLITEKPMALRVSDCDNMIEACKQNNVRLFVIFQNRYNPAIMVAKKALEEERFGKFVMSTVRVRWCRNQNYYDMDNWHGTWELDGGVMSQQASHYLDMLRYFMGPVESVQCQTTTSLLDIEAEDTSAAIIKFKSGVLGIFEATVATRPSDLEGSLSLLAENGHVIIGGRAANKIESWNFIDKRPEDETIKEQVFQEISDVYGFGHTQNIYEIIRAIRNNVMTPRVCTGESGRENIKILTALYESAALNGKHVVPGDLIKFTPLGNPCSEHRDRLN